MRVKRHDTPTVRRGGREECLR